MFITAHKIKRYKSPFNPTLKGPGNKTFLKLKFTIYFHGEIGQPAVLMTTIIKILKTKTPSRTVNFTVLFFGLQVIVVILAVFLHHGNGRAITPTIDDGIERILDLVEGEINTVFYETNEKTTGRDKENVADVLTLSEPDPSSHEAVQSQFTSDNMIQPKESRPVFRQRRSHAGPCYTDFHRTVQLASGGSATFPICKNVSLTGCGSSIAKYGLRKCEGSDHDTVSVILATGATETRVFPRKCSCAV